MVLMVIVEVVLRMHGRTCLQFLFKVMHPGWRVVHIQDVIPINYKEAFTATNW